MQVTNKVRLHNSTDEIYIKRLTARKKNTTAFNKLSLKDGTMSTLIITNKVYQCR